MHIKSGNSYPGSGHHTRHPVLSARTPISLSGSQRLHRFFTGIVFATLLLMSSYSHALISTFLDIKNETGQAVTIFVTPASCIHMTPEFRLAPNGIGLANGASSEITFFRDSLASGCSGENGHFYLTTNYGPGAQHFGTTSGGVWQIGSPGAFAGTLKLESTIPGVLNKYSWTMRDENSRLAKPADERLKRPGRNIAYDSGKWGTYNDTLVTDTLVFAQNGFSGSFYWECSGYETFHPQHMERLPNKNGRAYFMVTQSRAHNGYMYLVETYPGALDPVTDLVMPGINGASVGKIIWEDFYSGEFNGVINPVGNWNHPAKMSLMGGVLVVVAQNWSEGAPFVDVCNGSTSNPYQRGTTVDMLLFYDVRDPENPTYWGQMSAAQLGIPVSDLSNGIQLEGEARQIDSVNLTRDPIFDIYYLTVKGAGGAVTLSTSSISPNRLDWDTSVPPVDGLIPQFGTVTQQHGQDFTSYQWEDRVPAVDPGPGIRRNMQYDSADIIFQVYDSTDGGNFNPEMSFADALALGATDPCGFFGLNDCANAPFRDGFVFLPAASVTDPHGVFPTGDLLGNDVDWDADTFYVTRKGEPIIYGIISDGGPDGAQEEYGFNAHVYQTYDTRNLVSARGPSPVVETTVTQKYDNFIGSLRTAIGYGGKVTIDETVNSIHLLHGPLVVSLQDIEIDASAVFDGLKIYADSGNQDPVIQVTDGNTLKMNNIKMVNDPLGVELQFFLPWATSENGSWFVSAVDEGVQSGAVENSCLEPNKKDPLRHCAVGDNLSTYIQTAVTGPGTVTFDWKTSSEINDFLSFTITPDNGDPTLEPLIFLSGELDWRQGVATIPSGNHQLRWTYTKDVLTSSGGIHDAGFIKNVTFTPPALVITSVSNANGKQGQAFSYFITANRESEPLVDGDVYQYEAIGLPAGLYVDSSTGEITGNPSVFSNPTDFTVTVKVTEIPYLKTYPGSTAEATLMIHIDESTISVINALDLPDQPIPVTTTFFGVTGAAGTSTHDGTDALQSQAIGNYESSSLETTVYGPGTLTFWWKVSTGNGSLRFYLDDPEHLQPSLESITGEQDWQQISAVIPAGKHSIEWEYNKLSLTGGSDAGWIDEVVFAPDLGNAVDAQPLIWTTSGAADWAGQTQTTHDVPDEDNAAGQRDAAQSGITPVNGVSTLETTVTGEVNGTSILSFWWKVDSQPANFLRFFINGLEQEAISGDSGWQNVNANIPAGPQVLTWTYDKDIAAAGEMDAGWVDQVTLTPPHPIDGVFAVAYSDTLFNYQITAANQPTSLDVVGPLPPGLVLSSTTPGLITGYPTVVEDVSVILRASSEWGTNVETATWSLRQRGAVEPALRVDGIVRTWVTDLSYDNTSPGNWYAVTTDDGGDGDGYVVRSTTIDDGQQTDLETTVTGPGVLTFIWKVSSQQGSDFLQFTVNDLPQLEVPDISGVGAGWQQQTVLIAEGQNVLRWRYIKDVAGADGEDTGWLDEVSFTSTLVNTSADFGAGSLREIISVAPPGAIITFAQSLSGAEILLSSQMIIIDKALTLDASALENGLTLRQNNWRIFNINIEPADCGLSVEMIGLTLTGGTGSSLLPGDNPYGGAIRNFCGNLTLTDSTLLNNSAQKGGAIYNDTGTLILNNTIVRNNIAEAGSSGFAGEGGGIYTTNTLSTRPDTGLVTLNNSSVIDNIARSDTLGFGGGIYNDAFITLHITGSTVSGNTASDGAGILDKFDVDTVIENSTLSGNTGDAISSQDGSLTLINSTVSNNTVGIRLGNMTASISQTTIAANTGTGLSINAGSDVTLNNTIIADNSGSPSADISLSSGTITVTGANLIGDNSSVEAFFTADGVLVGTALNPVDPLLNVLGDYGGATQTMLPLLGSPAINAAITLATSPPTKDQRGLSRPQGIADDIGAVEVIVLVTNTNDSGPGSLRQVIADLPAGATVNFDESLSGSIITLAGTQLLLDKDIFIDATPLAGGLTIDANGTSRVFLVNQGINVTMKGIRITGGTSVNNGGGIFNYGHLNLINMTLTDNHATAGAGGGIINYGGEVSAPYDATLTMTNSTLDNNSATSGGGAIYNGRSSLAQVTLVNTTISGNSSDGPAGAIGNGQGIITLIHTTITNNTSNDSASGSIYNDAGTITIDNSVIAENINSAGATDIYSLNAGVVIYSGANLLSPLDPVLHVLGNYGGTTMTMPPTSTSPSVDAALDTVYTVQIGDQLGNSRPQGNGSDIGAVELVDSDGDGLSDIDENMNGTDPLSIDSDLDGLVDGDGGRFDLFFYPTGVDFDGDGFADGEQDFGTAPLLSDTDGDGLSDGEEVNTSGTNPLLSDTDGDGFSDGVEVNQYGSDPLVATDTPANGDVTEDGVTNAGDLVICRSFVLDNTVSPTEQQRVRCDMAPVNGTTGIPQPDGLINAADLWRLTQSVLQN